MPSRSSRRVVEPSIVGLKLMAGLPTNDGLSPVAPTLEPMGGVLVVARLVVGRGAQNYRKDSGQRILEIEEIEADLTAEEITQVQAILDAARERRTGEMTLGAGTLPGVGDDDPPPSADPEDWADGRAPGAPPHAHGKEDAEEPKAAKLKSVGGIRSSRRR